MTAPEPAGVDRGAEGRGPARRVGLGLLRWSLRASLAVVLVVAVVLGVLRHRLMARRDAIRAIDAAGGVYGVRVTGPEWYREFVLRIGGDERMFYDPGSVTLGQSATYDPSHPVTDDTLKALGPTLSGFGRMELLGLNGSGVTDEGLASLPKLPQLKSLSVHHTRVSLAAVKAFQRRHPGCAVEH